MGRKTRRVAGATAVALVLAAAFGFSNESASAATQSASCTSSPYAYAGLIGNNRNAAGVRATITALVPPKVASGHVAGWIGVGGPGRGANGEDAWIQIGVNAISERGTNLIYAEAWVPGIGHAYKELGEVEVGTKIRVAVVELPGKPGWWRASLNGNPVTKPVFLPGSHKSWEPMAITESWNGGRTSCNSYAYGFENVQSSTGSAWKPLSASMLSDQGYRVSARTADGFVAGSRS